MHLSKTQKSLQLDMEQIKRIFKDMTIVNAIFNLFFDTTKAIEQILYIWHVLICYV